MDARKNFASSLIATAPSPATSGTSLGVSAGEGSFFPTPPFNAVVCPEDERPSNENAEVVRVTNVSTDTLTVTRAQEGSVARAIVAGDQIFAGPTAKLVDDLVTELGLKADSSTLTAHTGNTSNPHSVTKSQVGLGSVDNTADTAKPVSTAQQTALDLKATAASVTSEASTRASADTALDTRVLSVESGRNRVGLLAARGSAATYPNGTYFATDANGGTLYVSDGSAWAVAGPRGLELGYAENTSGYTTASLTGPAYEDVTGLTLTFTVGDRPVVVVAGGPVMFASVAGARVRVAITDASNNSLTYSQATCVSASEHHPVGAMRYRYPAGTGSVSVKVRVGIFSGTASTATLLVTGGVAFLQALEV